MYLSYNWIRRYADLPNDLSMEDLSHSLTMRTVEVESIEDLSEKYANLVVGKILEVKAHPDADKLRVVTTDIGEESPVSIVCGGSNLEAGQLVAAALPGAKVIWHGEGEAVEIKETTLRGVASYGMICGASEIGLSDLFPVEDDHEIIDLGKFDISAAPGTPISEVLYLDDILIEIDNKSLTNRPDLWGHYGIARELAAIYDVPLKELPKAQIPEDLPKYPLEILDPEICNRFLACEFRNVDDRKSPLWLAMDLIKVGMRPLSLIVDITNYVMLATGQPTHAYDLEHIDEKIVVRRGNESEKLVLLDGKVLSLDADNTVIADASKALGLGGIMGGKDDSILPETKSIVFELANFNPAMIRKTAQEFGLRTEASMRFEKGVDTQRGDLALGLAQEMIAEYYPEAKLVAFHDEHPNPTKKKEITLSLAFLSRRLGMEVSAEDVKKYLEPLGFTLEERDGELSVVAPSWRSTGDVSLPDDILEETARMIGYENFTYLPPKVTLTKAVRQNRYLLERRLREYLALQCGFREVFTYPWVKDTFVEASGILNEKRLELAQPPAPDQHYLRDSLIYGIMEGVVRNIRYFDSFRFFEMAQVFEEGTHSPSVDEELLPKHRLSLGGVICGQDAETIFFEAKGVLEGLNQYGQFGKLTFEQVEKPTWADRNAWLSVCHKDEKIGDLALISNTAKAKAGIRFHDAAVFLLDVDRLMPVDSRTNMFSKLSPYPQVKQDISFIVPLELSWKEIHNRVSPLVHKVEFLEEYRGNQIAEGEKSVTLHITLESREATLTNEEITAKVQDVMNVMERIGAKVRS